MRAWKQALEIAAATPPARNRYADFLRAAAILVVIYGHWLMAAPFVENGQPRLDHILEIEPWTRWLTWVLQVMPTFFAVGGFSNAVSWSKTVERGQSYQAWLHSRLLRLVGPVLPLLGFWVVLGIGFHFAGVSEGMLKIGSQVALVPTWFLAVYQLVILCVPWTYRLWVRLGWGSFALFVVCAIAVDAIAFGLDAPLLRWVNYLFVWLGVHQLGYAWQARRTEGFVAPLLFVVGFALLLTLVQRGPYPISMVGVPGQDISNTEPPTLALFALGVAQIGLVLTLEGVFRRWLAKTSRWAATVLVNVNIMTLYLWHSSVLVLVIGLGIRLDGFGLTVAPATPAWWWSRIPWMLVMMVGLLPTMALFGRFERPGQVESIPRAPVLIASSIAFCAGIAVLAATGLAADNPLGIKSIVLLPIVACLAIGVRLRRG